MKSGDVEERRGAWEAPRSPLPGRPGVAPPSTLAPGFFPAHLARASPPVWEASWLLPGPSRLALPVSPPTPIPTLGSSFVSHRR